MSHGLILSFLSSFLDLLGKDRVRKYNELKAFLSEKKLYIYAYIYRFVTYLSSVKDIVDLELRGVPDLR